MASSTDKEETSSEKSTVARITAFQAIAVTAITALAALGGAYFQYAASSAKSSDEDGLAGKVAKLEAKLKLSQAETETKSVKLKKLFTLSADYIEESLADTRESFAGVRLGFRFSSELQTAARTT